MSATLFEKHKGSRVWWVRMTVPRADCISDLSRDRRSSSKFGPKAIAAAVAEEANGLLATARLQGVKVRARDLLRQAAVQLRGRHQGASAAAATLTVAEYAPSYLETLTPSTHETFSGIYDNHIRPTFGAMPMDCIGRRVVREWLTAQERTHAPGTADLHFRVFAAMLSQAVRDEEITSHPCRSVRDIRSGRKRKLTREARALTIPELAVAIRSLREVLPLFNDRGPLELQAATGVRIGESIAVKWSDVDFEAGSVRICRRIYRGSIGPTKGLNSRDVSLAPSLVLELRRQRAWQSEQALGRGKRAPQWVFTGAYGKPWTESGMGGRWRRVMIAAELLAPKGQTLREAQLGTHVLRHTYATHRLQAGVLPADVARVLGHSVATLLQIYAHAMPEQNRDLLRVDLDAIW